MTGTMFESNGLLDFPPSPPFGATASAAAAVSATVEAEGSATGPSSASDVLETPLDFEDDGGIFASLPTAHDGFPAGTKSLPKPVKPAQPAWDGPDEWEEEMLAMQEMEAEEELARQRSALEASERSPTMKGKGKEPKAGSQGGGGGDAGFGDSDLFESLADFEQMERDEAEATAGPSMAKQGRLSSIDLDSAGEDIEMPSAQVESRISGPAAVVTSAPRQAYLAVQPQQPKCHLPALRAETASGRMLYIKRRYKPLPRALPQEAPSSDNTGPSLLNQPLAALLREVQVLRDAQKAKEMEDLYSAEEETRALMSRARAHESGGIAGVDGRHSKRPADQSGPRSVAQGKQMWVDKYRPKRFADLLGEDRVHRDVLNWLKEWDQCVFKRTVPGKKRKLGMASGGVFGAGSGSSLVPGGEETNAYADPLGRPRDRILLLSGPPGFGKTTLAQILAKQAGYKTLEINASDDRNAATVSSRIKNAIDAGSGLGDAGKPVCVVVDEIDGATGGGDQSFIKSLIKLIQDVPANRKRNTPAKPLRRPIICICNDLYATALRPLRPFARVIRFRKPASQLLVKRLQEVCAAESLSADLRVLTTLVDLTGGDVRSCLNTLQFIESRSPTVSESAIRSLAVGSKDSSTSMHSAWQSLFVPLPAKVRRKQAGLGSKDALADASSSSAGGAGVDDGKYIDRLHAAVSTCGDVDKLIMGAFEHYPTLKPIDGSWGNYCRLLDGPLHFYDSVNKRVSENNEWEVMPYVAYSVVSWYGHLAAPANTTRAVEWPKADYEAYVTRTTNTEVATLFAQKIPPILRSMFCGTAVAVELVPYLMRIITPPLKPVNANIVKPAEKALLARLVELMIPLNLSFWVEKTESGQPMMRLEPAIDTFVHYEGKRADDVSAGRFAVRQLVAQAIDAEVARRRGAAAQDGQGDAQTSAESLKGMYGASKKTQSSVEAAVSKDTAVATDFFGRQIVKKPKLDKRTSGTSTPNGEAAGADDMETDEPVPEAIVKFRAVYRFHEGSSAAVRRGVKMSSLM